MLMFEAGGAHRTCFYKKDNLSFYSDNFGGSPDDFVLKQLPKPVTYHNYESQKTDSRLCGTYCLKFLHLIERMDSYNAVFNLF